MARRTKSMDELMEHKINHPEAPGGPKHRQLMKAPEWHHLWRPPKDPAPVKHLVKDGKPLPQ